LPQVHKAHKEVLHYYEYTRNTKEKPKYFWVTLYECTEKTLFAKHAYGDREDREERREKLKNRF
ncbi:MAG: hypothetical protein KKD28_00745, partial [Chloroflexi bacterium]|nr:hypothetical protein [Chloroflexota bacterium]